MLSQYLMKRSGKLGGFQHFGALFWLALMLLGYSTHSAAGELTSQTLDALAERAMRATGAQGMAIAVTDRNKIVDIGAYGVRNATGAPLTTDTIMYGASLTKAVFAVLVVQLASEGRINLDTPLATYLPQPLPSYATEEDLKAYAPWADLAGDERWRDITARMVLNHSTGFANFAFLEPDGKLKIHFAPGARYAYSGVGMMLLQFTLERGLGLDVGAEVQRRIFDSAGMNRTSMKWRKDFSENLADGFKIDGSVEAHAERSRVRAAGSMDTTIADFARFSAALSGGQLISQASLTELTRGTLPIRSASQFPTLLPELGESPFPKLAAGLGIVTFDGPLGPGIYKGGHNDSTGNTWVSMLKSGRSVVILSNDVRAEAAYPVIVRELLGETGVPWGWEYAGMTFWDGRSPQ